MAIYMCRQCGHLYDESRSELEEGIGPNVKFEDLPEDWRCPECVASKDEFELIL